MEDNQPTTLSNSALNTRGRKDSNRRNGFWADSNSCRSVANSESLKSCEIDHYYLFTKSKNRIIALSKLVEVRFQILGAVDKLMALVNEPNAIKSSIRMQVILLKQL